MQGQCNKGRILLSNVNVHARANRSVKDKGTITGVSCTGCPGWRSGIQFHPALHWPWGGGCVFVFVKSAGIGSNRWEKRYRYQRSGFSHIRAFSALESDVARGYAITVHDGQLIYRLIHQLWRQINYATICGANLSSMLHRIEDFPFILTLGFNFAGKYCPVVRQYAVIIAAGLSETVGISFFFMFR